MEPLLKWAGGKRALLNHIRPLLPNKFRTYFEPFMGGGALFFDTCPQNAVLADHNTCLIECYTQVRDNPLITIEILRNMKNTKEDYYKIRQSSPTTAPERAARMLYLTALSFNGLYRVNLRGEFNVPYGGRLHTQPCDPEKIHAASAALNGSKLIAGDFYEVVKEAGAGDFIYLDPPYTTLHNTNGFVKYNARIFGWNDQIRLAKTARMLAERGCHVIVSNADHPSVAELYDGFSVKVISRASIIAASSTCRKYITECLFYNEVGR